MAKFILDGQEYGGGSGSRIVKLTQAEYDALPNDKLSDDIIYLIKDSGELTAENLFYDGSETGLGNNVQDAVDNLDEKVSEQNKNLLCFIDTSKLIYSNTGIFEYTPTQNCWLVGQFHTTNGRIYIDNTLVYDVEDPSSSGIRFSQYMPIKAGQKVNVETHSTYGCSFYGTF